MSHLAVTGYASLDYALALSGQIAGDRTTLIDHRDASDWPRVGGCPAYLAMAAARQGMKASPVSWIGADHLGRIYLDSLTKAGVGTEGVERLDEPKSPMSVLAYQADGSCACLFDPAFTGREELTDKQRDVIAAASHLCVSVGPPQILEPVLACRTADARLYWVLKNDAHAFPDALARRLSAEADVIFCSRSEHPMIGATAKGAVIVETRGAGEIRIEAGTKRAVLQVEPVSVHDTTGAGDSFAGGFIAAEMAGETDPEAAARAGAEAARTMLQERSEREKP
ncbi:MAG: PfkB family carbohydrate kinase [Rhizobiaceae bacterium]